MHLVKVTDVQPSQTRPFDEVRDRLAQEWHRQRQENAKQHLYAGLMRKYRIVADPAVRPLLPSILADKRGGAMRLRLLALDRGLLSPLAVARSRSPARLSCDLQEDAPGEFSVVWKTPMIGDLRLALDPEISGPDRDIGPDGNPDDRQRGRADVAPPGRQTCAAGPCGSQGLETHDDRRARAGRVHGRQHLGPTPDAAAAASRQFPAARVAGRSPERISALGSSTSCSASITCCSSWPCSFSRPEHGDW